MQRTKWIDRKFSLDLPPGWLPNVLERLHGTAPRIVALTASLSEAQAVHKPDGKWSIKEHIGHLSDLEILHDGRIDDFLARHTTLRAADMQNAKTYEAAHNEKPLSALIQHFALKRAAFIARLAALDDDTQGHLALHPRLQMPMRPVDMAFFTAEHDDHHLATMRLLLP